MIPVDSWPKNARPLVKRVYQWISQSLDNTPNDSLLNLAADIYEYQCANDLVAQKLRTGAIDSLLDIPPVPVQLFKQLSVGTVNPSIPHTAFLTSGTSQDARGVQRLFHPALYEWSATQWARRCEPNLPIQGIHLLLDPKTHPESSLSHMVDKLCTAGSQWYLPDGRVDSSGFEKAIQHTTAPLFIGTTAFALADYCDRSPHPRQSEGSVLMVTGGFKGRRLDVSDTDVYAAALQYFPGIRIVTEYGMTELSSQLWGEPGRPYRAPPWMRVWACDPLTGVPRDPGEVGQLRFFDLANVDTALSIFTMDRGSISEDGSVTLLGRLQNASARGCSLTVEDALGDIQT